MIMEEGAMYRTAEGLQADAGFNVIFPNKHLAAVLSC